MAFNALCAFAITTPEHDLKLVESSLGPSNHGEVIDDGFEPRLYVPIDVPIFIGLTG